MDLWVWILYHRINMLAFATLKIKLSCHTRYIFSLQLMKEEPWNNKICVFHIFLKKIDCGRFASYKNIDKNSRMSLICICIIIKERFSVVAMRNLHLHSVIPENPKVNCDFPRIFAFLFSLFSCPYTYDNVTEKI